MRILTILKKKKESSTLFFLILFLLLGVSHAKAASLTLGQAVSIEYSGTGTKYEFQAPSTGTLKVVLNPGSSYGGISYGKQGDTELLYESNGTGVPSIRNNGEDVGAPFLTNLTEAEFNVTAGNDYYIKIPYWQGTCLAVMTTSGGDDVIAWVDLELGRRYSGYPYNLTFTPSSNGVLTVKQEGSFDNFLYDNENCDTPLTNTNGLVTDGIITYDVVKGTKYYYRTNEKVASVEFAFTAGTGPTPGTPEGGTQEGSEIQLDVPFNINAIDFGQTAEPHTFIPDFNGFVYVKTNSWTQLYGPMEGSISYILFNNSEGNDPVIVEAFNGDDYNWGGWIYKMSVTKGKTYYLIYDGDLSVIFTRTLTPVLPPIEVPDGYDPLPYVTGPLTNPQQSDAVQITSVGNKYCFQAPSDGKLVVWQWGTSRTDGHLWKVPLTNDNWEPWGNDVQAGGQTPGQPTPNPVPYSLEGGKTYYWYAKSSQGITYAIFAWEGTDTNTIPTIEENQATKVGPGMLYKYTPSANGLLTVKTDKYTQGVAAVPNIQYFFFSDSGHTNLVPALETFDGADVEEGAKGNYITFMVDANKTYYLFNDVLEAVTYTFVLEPGKTIIPALKTVEPLPGGIDNDAQESTITIQFYPGTVTVESVDFVYTDATTQKPVTISNINCEFLGGAYQVPRAQHLLPSGEKLWEGVNGEASDAVYYQISRKEGAIQNYVLHGVKFNGQPVTVSEIENGVDVTADGTFTLHYAIDTPPALINWDIPETFYKSWEKGDRSGMMTLTYNKPLDASKMPEVTVMDGKQVYGSTPGEDDKSWKVNPTHVTIEGSKLFVDFTGEDAILAVEEEIEGVTTTTPFSPQKSQVTIYVGGVTGANQLLAMYGEDPAFMPVVNYVNNEAAEPDPIEADLTVMTDEDGWIYEWKNGVVELPVEFFNKGVNYTSNVDFNDVTFEITPTFYTDLAYQKGVDAGYTRNKPEITFPYDKNKKVLSVTFPCSGTYDVWVSSKAKYLFEGKTSKLIGTATIYPSLDGMVISYMHKDVKNSFSADASGNINYKFTLTLDGEDWYTDSSKRPVIELSGTDVVVWYRLHGYEDFQEPKGIAPKAVRALADEAEVDADGFTKVGEDGTINLAPLAYQDTNTMAQMSFKLTKNGATTPMLSNGQSTHIISFTKGTNETVGVDAIGADNGEVEYFDLNGMKVNPENLTKGIYIVKNGKEVSKVILK